MDVEKQTNKEYDPVKNLKSLKAVPETIFLARDMVFYRYNGCLSRDEAEQYINSWSGNGYIEVYELSGNYYYFKGAEWIGSTKGGAARGPVMGEQLNGGGIPKEIRDIILSCKK